MKKKFRFFIQFVLLFSFMNCFGQVDTLNSYSELRSYSGSNDSIFINHSRYHGLFVQADCEKEDYGTVIIAFSGVCWKRVFNNYLPRFWAINGPSNDRQIKRVLNEADAINTAALSAYEQGGDTIEIDFMVGIDRPINLFTHNTYLGTSDSAGFYRVQPPITILTNDTQFGDKKIFVESNAGFKTFQKINIASGQQYDSIAGHVSYTGSILASDERTIFLSGLSMREGMKAGDSVSLFFSMMQPGITDLGDVFLSNLVFHGNREYYKLNYDWRVNTTISIPTTENSTIEGCRFYEIPSENIFICGATVIDCSGNSFNGSALHFSCNSTKSKTQVLYNNFSYLNEVGDDIMQHSEGAFTFSAKVQNLRVAYNVINNTQESGIGEFNNNDFNNEITDNLIVSDGDLIKYQAFYDKENLVYNNKNANLLLNERARLLNNPSLVFSLPCQSSSSLENPLDVGDTITIRIDTILTSRPNENFIKCIIPIYDSTYFDLIDVSVSTDSLGNFHTWTFDNSSLCKGAVFDNGHRGGLYAEGNWGYAPCNEKGGCTDIRISFIVAKLPDCESQIECPLEGIEVYFDGDLGSWIYSPELPLDSIMFNRDSLGFPFLKTLGEPSESDYSTAFCEGDSIEINGKFYTEPGDYLIYSTNTHGCDSLVFLELSQLDTSESQYDASFCEGDTLEVAGNHYYDPGDFEVTLKNAQGCDSIVSISLTRLEVSESQFEASFCEGDSIEINGQFYSRGGEYQISSINSFGCDSIIHIELTELLFTDSECHPLNLIKDQQLFEIYPNPATSFLKIKSQKKIVNLKVFSINGKHEKSLVVDGHFIANLNLEGLSVGVKLLKVHFEDGSIQSALLLVK